MSLWVTSWMEVMVIFLEVDLGQKSCELVPFPVKVDGGGAEQLRALAARLNPRQFCRWFPRQQSSGRNNQTTKGRPALVTL